MRRFHRHHESDSDTPASRGEDAEIDLRVPHLSNKDLLEWGMPGHCPECGAFGYLDRIDLVAEVMHQHCPSCWNHWKVTKHDIEVSAARGPSSSEA
jgi:hypothetical protein